MSTHKHFDKICYAVLALVLVITILLLLFADSFTVVSSGVNMEYANKLFDDSYVHSIDIIMDDWDGFTQSCENEEYTACNLVIDGETYNNVAIRAKGNTSLTQVSSYGNNRYSFKIEFDKYDSSVSYYGLDKLCLNNIIQDNTYMKDYLVYSLMGDFGVASPLCSYVNISVNGETFGLYLTVEGVEESFLERNYGTDYGELYKPDSMSMGGGKGNGKAFEADDDAQELPDSNSEVESDNDNFPQNNEQQNNFQPIRGEMPDGQADFKKGNMPAGSNGMKDGEPPEMPQNSEGENAENPIMPDAAPDINNAENNDSERKTGFGNMSAKGSDDVSLIYSDDDYDSYSNIFDNAKTNITDSDKDRLIASVKNINNNENIGSSVDVEQVIRYFVVHNYVLNFDSYTGSMIHNYYLYEKDGKLSMIPWDYNLAFGSFNSSMDAESLINYPIDEPVSGGTVESRPMLAWIFANEEYTELYHELFSEFIAEFFDNSKVEAMIAKTQEMISPYVKADPTKFCTYDEFETGAETLSEFCLLRAESISGQLDGTIGSTSEAQADSDTLIKAENIVVSAMGSMNNGGAGRNGQKAQTVNSDEDNLEQNDNNTDDGNAQKMPNDEALQTGANPADFKNISKDNSGLQFNVDTETIITAVITVLTLAIGLAVALIYRKRA